MNQLNIYVLAVVCSLERRGRQSGVTLGWDPSRRHQELTSKQLVQMMDLFSFLGRIFNNF